MSTHYDWELAKLRRDSSAYLLAKAYLAKNLAEADRLGVQFKHAEDDMHRIEKELDGRADK